MSHLTSGQLRAQRDGQLDPVSQSHLADCAECRAQLGEIEARATRVQSHLAALAPQAAELPSAGRLFAQLKSREGKEGLGMLKNIFARRMRPLWVGVSVITALAVAFSFAPVRAWAADFLGLFRVQRIAVLEIDPANLERYSSLNDFGPRIESFFAETAVIKGGGEPQTVDSAEAAEQAAGYAVRLPVALGQPSRLLVQPGLNIALQVDLARAQAILDELGRADIRLPESLDGETVTFDIPTSVTALYNCPEMEAAGQGEYNTECVAFAQLPSPTVQAPDDLDVVQLAQAMLEFTGLSPEQARKLSQRIDWTTTLVVPVPTADGMEYFDVTVDGVPGTLIRDQSNSRYPGRYILLWVKDGMLYSLTGQGQVVDTVVSIANTLE
jgi:hypothetical protein